jgi:hypothetical protein
VKFTRAKFMLNHYRNIKRKHFDHQMVDDFVKKASTRKKRSIDYYHVKQMPHTDYNIIDFLNTIVSHKQSREKRKRDSRDYVDIDRAYSKYYEKIKAKYRNYVRNLFPNQKPKSTLGTSNHQLQEQTHESGSRWNNNAEHNKYRALQKARSFSNDLQNEETGVQAVAIPTINDQMKPNKHDSGTNMTISNYYPSHNVQQERVIDDTPSENHRKSPTDLAANIYAQLQSQIVRRKRETDDDGKDDDTSAGGGKKKNRGPCEALLSIEHMQIEVVKQAKNPSENFGHGMVLKITCNTGYSSNVQTANSTVRCNKGVWKPVKPACTLSECLIKLK